MAQISFEAFLWKEFKNFVSKSSMTGKISFFIFFIILITFFVSINDFNNNPGSNDQKSNASDEIGKTSNSDNSLIKKLHKGNLIYEVPIDQIVGNDSKISNLPIGEPILVGVAQSNFSRGILIDTDPIVRANSIVIHLDTDLEKMKPGKLLILEIRKQKLILSEIQKDAFYDEIQKTAYALNNL